MAAKAKAGRAGAFVRQRESEQIAVLKRCLA
jgi:hypothetical protein